MERIKTNYDDHRFGLQSRLETLNLRLGERARVNLALGLGRVPKLSARILRKLDSAGLLGRHLFVVGSHAPFAHEAAAGIFFESGLTETTDVDLLRDVRRRLRVALVDARAEGVIGLLKKVDRSFTVRRNNWVSRRDDREPLKRGRDFSQAKTVATVAVEYWRLAFDAKELSALPAHLVQASDALLAA
jgi:hypothetical protein